MLRSPSSSWDHSRHCCPLPPLPSRSTTGIRAWRHLGTLSRSSRYRRTAALTTSPSAAPLSRTSPSLTITFKPTRSSPMPIRLFSCTTPPPPTLSPLRPRALETPSPTSHSPLQPGEVSFTRICTYQSRCVEAQAHDGCPSRGGPCVDQPACLVGSRRRVVMDSDHACDALQVTGPSGVWPDQQKRSSDADSTEGAR